MGLAIFFFVSHIHASELTGTWRYEKTFDFDGSTLHLKPIKNTTLQFLNDQLGLPKNCFQKFTKEEYAFGLLFQGMSKEGVTEKQISNYFNEQFSIDLSKIKTYFSSGVSANKCSEPFRQIVVSKNTLVAIYGESTYYVFKKSTRLNSNNITNPVNLYHYKLSSLPFNGIIYGNFCGFGNCAPVFYRYKTSKDKSDSINRLVNAAGDNIYDEKKLTNDGNKLPSGSVKWTFLLLPPLGNVLLLRVDDYDDCQNRDCGNGFYLAIQNEKFSDKLVENCHITEDYFCIDDDGKRLYQLTQEGKFKKIK